MGPTMAAKGFADIKIMIVDDQRNKLPEWVQTVNIPKPLPIVLHENLKKL